MSKILYNPGDKVVVHDASSPIDKYCSVGDVLTIVKKMNDNHNTYYVKEFSACIAASRFRLVSAFKPVSHYDGWPNKETEEAAIVFFNDSNRLEYVREKLMKGKHISVDQAANMIRNIELSCGDSDQICIRSILEDNVRTHQQRFADNIPASRYKTILHDIAASFDYIIEPSLEDQAQAIADHTQKAADSFQKVADGLKRKECPDCGCTQFKLYSSTLDSCINCSQLVGHNPSHPIDDSPMEIKSIMKIETKHYVNDIDIATMTIDQKVALIKKTEDQIDELKKVKTESQMVRNEIAKLSKFLIEAVVLFDE